MGHSSGCHGDASVDPPVAVADRGNCCVLRGDRLESHLFGAVEDRYASIAVAVVAARTGN